MLGYIIAFVLGIIVGAVAMLFVYRNNPEKSKIAADKIEKNAKEAAKKATELAQKRSDEQLGNNEK